MIIHFVLSCILALTEKVFHIVQFSMKEAELLVGCQLTKTNVVVMQSVSYLKLLYKSSDF